jgi:hypothetical protein
MHVMLLLLLERADKSTLHLSELLRHVKLTTMKDSL